nr:PTS transporter subunit EIIC [Eggerthella sinensis]
MLLIGSFSLIFLNLPLPGYREFLAATPWFKNLFDVSYAATLGIFSLYVAVAISLRYAHAYAGRFGDFFTQGAPFAALAAYLMCVGFGSAGFDKVVLSTRSLFIAIMCGLLSSMVYCRLVRALPSKRRYGDNIDGVFNQAVTSLIPIGLVVALFACVNVAVTSLFGVESVEALFFASVSALFPLASATLGSGLLYLLMNNVMWFFGIHGGNMLDAVAQSIFVPGTAANAAALAAGGEPVQIVTKTFLDVFASIGGAGALLSLLVAILLFGRRRNVRRLSAFAALPMVFNVSEIMMFGLPVVWNPVLFVPFIVVPLVNMVIAYAAMAVGLVPPVITDVSWTTPPLVGGYLATGSVAGAVLQLACIVLGALIYLPFLRWYERVATERENDEYRALMAVCVEAERAGQNVELTALPGALGAMAASLAEDVRLAVEQRALAMGAARARHALPAAVRHGGAGRGGRGAAALRASAVRHRVPAARHPAGAGDGRARCARTRRVRMRPRRRRAHGGARARRRRASRVQREHQRHGAPAARRGGRAVHHRRRALARPRCRARGGGGHPSAEALRGGGHPSARRCAGTRAPRRCSSASWTPASRWPSTTSPWAARRSSTSRRACSPW